MPLAAIEQNIDGVQKDAEIIAYCVGPQCPQSKQAVQRLSELGFTNVRAFEEGLEGWKAAGHPTGKLQEPVPAG